MAHSKKTCATSLMEIAGKYMEQDEVSAFILEHQATVKRIQNENRLISLDKAEAQAMDEVLTRLDKQVATRKRNAAYALKQRIEVTNYILDKYKDKPIEGFNAMLAGSGGDINAIWRGSKGFVEGSKDSINNDIILHQNTTLNAFMDDMMREDVWEIFNSGKLDQEIFVELFNLREGGQAGKSGSDMAVKIAEILESHQEHSRLNANEYGADIEKLQGYIISQSHDYYKLKPTGTETKQVAKQRWKDTVRPLLNLELTFKSDDMKTIDRYLGEVYDQLLSGVHLDFENPLSRFQGPGSLQKRISASRHLVFKDGESAFKYNNTYGTGTLSEGYTGGLRRLATNTALIKRLGVNPRDNLNQIFQDLKTIYSRQDNADIIHSFREDAGTGMPKSSQNLIASILGDTQKVANHTAAKVGVITRAIESMAKLGSSLVTSFSDVGLMVEEAAFQGRGRIAGITDVVKGLSGNRTPEEKRIASAMGVVSEVMPGLMVERYGLDVDLSGKITKALQIYFNINGQRYWTDNLREGHALGISHYFGSHIKDGSKFTDLPAETQHILKSYNITDKEWDLYSKVDIEHINGRDYLAVENLQNIPDIEFAKYLGIDETTPMYQKKLKLGKEVVIGKIQNYVTDRANIAVTQPDVHVKSLLLQGTRPGTFEGEAMRAFGQFKSFPTAMINNSINKLIYAKGGGDNALDAIMKGNSSLGGLANTFVQLTLMGYISMTVKDYLKGRNPRPMNLQTWTAAMLQGGSMGLYGDVLFGESSKYGQDFISSVAGPTGGLINDVVQTARAGEDILKVGTKRLDNHIPLANLFYIKPFFDFMIMNNIQEAVNPGYLERMERQISADTEQSFWLRPSELVK